MMERGLHIAKVCLRNLIGYASGMSFLSRVDSARLDENSRHLCHLALLCQSDTLKRKKILDGLDGRMTRCSVRMKGAMVRPGAREATVVVNRHLHSCPLLESTELLAGCCHSTSAHPPAQMHYP